MLRSNLLKRVIANQDVNPLPENTVAYWKMNETSGNMIDLVNGYNGTLGGTITRDGEYYEFDSAGDIVNVSDQDDFSFKDGVDNVDFVVKTEVVFNGFNSRNRAWIISKRESPSAGVEEWQLIYLSGNLNFYFFDSSGNQIALVSATFSPTIGQKYIIGVTLNGATLDLFIDGSIVKSLDVTGINIFNGTSKLQFGSADLTTDTHLIGKMKESLIIKGSGWDSTQISNNYNGGDGVSYDV